MGPAYMVRVSPPPVYIILELDKRWRMCVDKVRSKSAVIVRAMHQLKKQKTQ